MNPSVLALIVSRPRLMFYRGFTSRPVWSRFGNEVLSFIVSKYDAAI